MKPRNRKLVESIDPQDHEPNLADTRAPPDLLEPINATVKKPLNPNAAPFDSSMALTVLALLIALFFMGLFSIYIRRFAASSDEDNSRRHRRRHSNITTTTTSNNNSPTAIYVGRPPLRHAASSNNKGVDPSTVRSLPVYYYHGGGDEKQHRLNDDCAACAVCLSEFEEREEVKMIPYCRHVFHPYCIERWLQSHVSCPLCRTTRFFPDEVVEIEKEPEEGRSTVEIGDAWTSGGVRRTSSCSSLGERVSLQRTSSF